MRLSVTLKTAVYIIYICLSLDDNGEHLATPTEQCTLKKEVGCSGHLVVSPFPFGCTFSNYHVSFTCIRIYMHLYMYSDSTCLYMACFHWQSIYLYHHQRLLWALAPLYPNPDCRRSWFRHCLNKVPWPAGHAHPSEIRVKALLTSGLIRTSTLNCHVIYPIYMYTSFTNTIPYPLYCLTCKWDWSTTYHPTESMPFPYMFHNWRGRSFELYWFILVTISSNLRLENTETMLQFRH